MKFHENLFGELSKSSETPAWNDMWHTIKTSSLSGTKSKNLNVSRLVVQMSLPNLLKPGVKSRMKM